MFPWMPMARRATVAADPIAVSLWAKLVAWWEYEDITVSTPNGNTIFDSHIGGHNFSTPDTVRTAFADTTNEKIGNVSLKRVGNVLHKIFIPRSNTTFDFGDTSFSIAGWFRVDADTSFGFLVGRFYSATGERSYVLDARLASAGVHNAQWTVSGNGTSSTNVSISSAFGSSAEWAFLVAQHDAVADQIRLSKNAGTETSASFSGGVYASSPANFALGMQVKNNTTGNTDFYGNNSYDGTAVFSDVLTADERSWLYNSGAGRTYAELKTASGN